MKDNKRRDFLKTLGVGSGTLLMTPMFAFDKAAIARVNEGGPGPADYTRRIMDTDVVVAGGGMSGLCAALAAARNGIKVILIQNRSRLGGNASSEIRMHISGASNLRQVWRETGILEEIMLTDAVVNQQTSYEIFDYIMYDKVLSEKNITLLLDAMLFDVESRGKEVKAVKAYCSQTEELYEISARYFMDCTGDGTLAAIAGAEFMRGREAKSLWNEPLGLDKADNITMGNSLLFMAEEHDRPMPYIAPAWARKYTKADFVHRKITSYEYGYWWIELGGVNDIVNDGQQIRHELMCVVFGIWDYIKNSGNHPDAENWALSWVGTLPGKRESRRIVGDYIMKQQDVQFPQLFEDRVAYGGWPLDDHLPLGMDDTSQNPFRSIQLKGPYSIPLRSLYSKSFTNLLMAGRNISASHIALSSTRVMATCAAMGQAIGTAAAYCLQNGLTPKRLCVEKASMEAFLQLLLRQDQSLLGVVNADPADLARMARVSASHETPAGNASQVIDGINRDIRDGKTHQWQAEMASGREPWIELNWDKPVELSNVECTFDTGLARYLRISGQKSVLERQVRGPQPETLADYKIQLRLGGRVVFETHVNNNYLRKTSHNFTLTKADAMRITAIRTHGDPLVRIFEIRCYQ